MNLFKLRQPEPDPDEENSIEGERALASVNKGLTLQNKIINWAVVCGACALAGGFLFKYYNGMFKQYQENKAQPKDVSHTVATTSLPPLMMPDPVPVKTAAVVTADDKLPPLQPPQSPIATGTAPAGQPPVKSEAELIRERRLKRELRFNLEGGTAGAAQAAAATDVATTGADASAAPTSAVAPIAGAAKAVQPAHFSAARAYMLPDPTLMMTRGKVIPCTVLPAMDTTLTGMVSCVTAEDATGADGKVSLMDRGTLCTGQQGGGVTHGQRRVGIIWQRCETPQHVLVPLLDSGATDALGRPGIAGDVNNHFWDRFGAAIALSLISNIGPYLVATRQSEGNNSNNTILFPNIVSGPQELMSEVLRNTADIPPTITAPQAQRVLIYVAGDIDFRDVYQLEGSK
jgi:type IV secretion system protein VirB10